MSAPPPIEDLAIVGDTQTVAVVDRRASIVWLCLPRFDSAACFASLLGGPEHGRWSVTPRGELVSSRRRYRGDTLVLETELVTDHGTIRVTDAMPVRGRAPDIVRLVEGVSGEVTVDVELVLRFDYGRTRPWVRTLDGRVSAIAGPDAVVLTTPADVVDDPNALRSTLTLRSGDRVPFVLTWFPSHERAPEAIDAERAIAATASWWTEWASRCRVDGTNRDHIVRSLVTLKALTYAPTGGIVAAGTTSLPEALDGNRNWDYRFCWLRDAAFTLYAMLHAGYRDEAEAWRDWLLRAVAGDPQDLQIMYGVAGERMLDERTIPWLPGYGGAAPVRIGNAASRQLQLDVYGEVLDTFHQARRLGVPPDEASWPLQRTIADWLESNWRRPDEGLWEVRGPRRCFTYSKVMAWVAMDRAVKAVEQHGMSGTVDRWKRARAEIHADVCAKAFDAERGTFTQSYGDRVLDASLLRIPSVGFLPARDPRVRGTIAAIEKDLVRDGFVLRYPTGEGKNLDGLEGREGAFLACSFWLVDAYVLSGRHEDGQRLFERLVALRNDVGLLSEEYDVARKRLVGNFPQAFSHVALVNSARDLASSQGPSQERERT